MLVLAAVAAAATVEAQFRGRMFARIAAPDDFEGRFMFCRIVFNNAIDGDGGGWSVDYPRADENVSIRLSELTKTSITRESDGSPRHVLVRFSDPQIFSCPFVMMTEPGGAFLTPQEAEGLRAYVEKGGFLWADDFWGNYAWAHWEAQLRKALPANDFPIFELPPDHPLYNVAVRSGWSAADPGDRLRVRRSDIGARSRQRRAARASDRRQPRPPHGADDPEHRHRRFVGARRRRPAVISGFRSPRLRVRHQRDSLRTHSLGWRSGARALSGTARQLPA